jgi:hypothetical protein
MKEEEEEFIEKVEETKKMVRIWRQGDVIVREVTAIPSDSVRSETDEVRIASETGHAHVLKGVRVFVNKNPSDPQLQGQLQQYVILEEPSQMVHPQHAALQLSRGMYRVTTVRDYAPARRLLD